MNTLQEALRLLAHCREDAARAKEESDQLGEAYRATPEYRAFMDARTTQTMAEETVRVATETIKILAIEDFEDTRNKQPASGVSIREYRRAVYEPAQALVWCKAFMPALVQETVDAKKYESMADDLAELGAPIEIVSDTRATISGDLSQYLAKEKE